MINNSVEPLVSIIIPSYNSSRYLLDALHSVANQTYKNIEIILIDDGSTDNTWEIIQNLQIKIPNLLYIKKNNEGIASALNFGLDKAKGAYIARMDADDISNENRILEQVKYLESNKDIDLVSCSYIAFSGDTNKTNTVIHPSDPDVIKLLLCYCSPICHPAVIAKASIFKKFKYNPKVTTEDHDLWCKLSLNYKLTNIEEPLLFYRRHENSYTKRKKWKIRFSSFFIGLKYFFIIKRDISKIPFKLIMRNKLIYNNINWNPAIIYLIISKIICFKY
jgi:glycosyltransferase involved in cell wall biosynthesis